MQIFGQFEERDLSAIVSACENFARKKNSSVTEYRQEASLEKRFAALMKFFFEQKLHESNDFTRLKIELYDAGIAFSIVQIFSEMLKVYNLPEQLVKSNSPQKLVIRASFRFQISDFCKMRMLNVESFKESPETEAAIELLEDYARETGCLRREKVFHNEHSRFVFFRTKSIVPEKIKDYGGNTVLFLIGGSEEMQKQYIVENKMGAREIINFWSGVFDEGDFAHDKKILAPLFEVAEKLLDDGLPLVFSAPFFIAAERGYWVEKCYKQKMKVHFVVFTPEGKADFFEKTPYNKSLFFSRFEMPDKTECHRFDEI
jgi:hypothetical protein